MTDESVYFIAVGNYFKVGRSGNPERRFRNLFRSSTSHAKPWDCPKDLASRQLVGYVDGDIGDERAAHRALAEFGVGCEFFLDEPEVRAYVAKCLAGNRVYRTPIKRPHGQAEFVGQVRRDREAESAQMRAVMAKWDHLIVGRSA